MTIDEAILHAREVVEKSRKIRNSAVTVQGEKQCIKCAVEHEQLAEWLEELKELRAYKEKIEMRKTYHCEDCLHLVNQRKGPRGAITGMCELRKWRGRRAGRTVACKKMKSAREKKA